MRRDVLNLQLDLARNAFAFEDGGEREGEVNA